VKEWRKAGRGVVVAKFTLEGNPLLDSIELGGTHIHE